MSIERERLVALLDALDAIVRDGRLQAIRQ